MITRRALISTGVCRAVCRNHRAVARSADPAAPNDPVAILTAIYTRAAKGKGDGGGAFVIENKAAKAKYLSKSLIALWAKADAHTPKGDVGPVDFDPVTNSQEPDVKSFKVAAEKLEADKADHRGHHHRPLAARKTPPTRSCAMILCARAAAGRSTTSRAQTMARPGRSVPCWKNP